MEEPLQQPEIQPTRPDNKKKLMIIGIILAFLIIGSVAVAGYCFFVLDRTTPEEALPLAPSDLTSPAQPETPVEEPVAEDETADWQTYRNEEYGWELKYPSGWHMYDKGYRDPGEPYFNYPFKTVLFQPVPFPEEITGRGYQAENGLEIKTEEGAIDLDGLSGAYSSDPIYSTSFIQFAGERTLKAMDLTPETDIPAFPMHMLYIFNHGERHFVIYFQIETPAGYYNPAYDQVLSTFKFIEPDETADWTTF